MRTEPADPGPLSEADRAARIEQLLLSGLDHYFGGDYEQAIHVWTRVAFLERGHGRARAYIERARSAQAERQRESEECVDKGVAAYQAGELQTARELLTRAVEQGGPNETAMVFLQRLGRADAVTVAPRAPHASARRVLPRRRSEAPGGRMGWITTALASTVIVAAILIGALGTASWLRESPVAVRSGEPAPPEALPVIRDSEIRISKANRLQTSGRLREALEELDVVQLGDPLRPEADRLKADIQRALLSKVSAEGSALTVEPPR